MANARMIKTCHLHGETEFRNDSSIRLHYRCCKCQTEAVKKCRDKLKERAVEYKGGCCEWCGYNKCIQALEFHHIDPTQKDFAIGFKGHTRSFDKVKLEIDKCLLLCANCHREEHANLRE